MKEQKHSESILDLVGNTPLVPIKRLNPNPKVKMFAKLEGFNPGGSVKDRIALKIIEEAERSGELTPDKVIIEATSGNTGIGLAMVAAVKGYSVILAMSEGVSIERRKILAALGASFLLTKPELGTDGAIERVYQLVRTQPERYFMADQYNNPNNPKSHYDGTGMEIIEQTEGKLTHFVASLGTTGTLMGCSERLKEFNPDIQIIGAEPYLNHRIQGLKNLKEAYRPGIFNRDKVDELVPIEDEDAFGMTRKLALEEGIFAGMSSGAAMYVAIEKAKELEEGIMVVLLPDGGEKYLSTTLFSAKEEDSEELKLNLFNTLSRKRERLLPIYPNEVRMYSCGPTVHTHTHIGVCRRMLVADLLRRYLESYGIMVRHVVNITDMNDRTIDESERKGVSLEELTQKYTDEFLEDMESLRIRKATRYPRASDALLEMVEMTDKLISKGYAYEKLRSVYFNISAMKDYGELSQLNMSKIKLGVTVDLDEYEKDSPGDFSLFKRSNLSDLKRGIFFETPWGNVKPGWHLECAAISTRHLGEHFDIHLSSTDLLFPHLENDLSMCKAAHGKDPANFWVLSGTINSGKKISRSSGDLVNLRDFLKLGYSPREVRFLILNTHYHKNLNFSYKGLERARKILNKLDGVMSRLANAPRDVFSPIQTRQWIDTLTSEFKAAMDRDLNVSLALAAVFKFTKRINLYLEKGKLGAEDAQRLLNKLREIDSVFAFLDVPSISSDPCAGTGDFPAAIWDLISRRESARAEKDYKTADILREELEESGVRVEDSRNGPRIFNISSDD